MSPSATGAARELHLNSDFDRWYWYRHGDEFAVDCCVPKDGGLSEERTPAGGSQLCIDDDGELLGKNATGGTIAMVVYESVMTSDRRGICQFIAEAHEAMMAVVRSGECASRRSQFLADLVQVCRSHRVLVDEPDCDACDPAITFREHRDGDSFTVDAAEVERTLREALWDGLNLGASDAP